MGQVWRDWQARTSFLPFGAVLSGRVGAAQALPGPIALVGGVVLWALITSLHAQPWSPLALLD